MRLIEYLKNLNTQENQWGLWVNPENVDEFRVGQFCFENGGRLDGWVMIGSLDDLSFGYQSMSEAIESLLTNHHTRYKAGIIYKGKEVRANVKGLLQAYNEGLLDEDFRIFLEQQAQEIQQIWAEMEAEDFVHNKIPEIISQSQEEVLV